MTLLQWIAASIIFSFLILGLSELAEQNGIARWSQADRELPWGQPRGYLMTGDK